MYTHRGMPIDTLGHLGYNARTFNGFEAEKHPLTNAALHRVKVLPDSHGTSPDDLKDYPSHQRIELRPGDFVMVRNGRTIRWPIRPPSYATDPRRPIPQPELPHA